MSPHEVTWECCTLSVMTYIALDGSAEDRVVITLNYLSPEQEAYTPPPDERKNLIFGLGMGGWELVSSVAISLAETGNIRGVQELLYFKRPIRSGRKIDDPMLVARVTA